MTIIPVAYSLLGPTSDALTFSGGPTFDWLDEALAESLWFPAGGGFANVDHAVFEIVWDRGGSNTTLALVSFEVVPSGYANVQTLVQTNPAATTEYTDIDCTAAIQNLVTHKYNKRIGVQIQGDGQTVSIDVIRLQIHWKLS